MEYKVIIAGTRKLPVSEAWLLKKLEELMASHEKVHGCTITHIVSGVSGEVDMAGCILANAKGLPVEKHPANWDTYGRSAGHIRNHEMANTADALILLWDGESPGSKNMRAQAEKKGLAMTEFVLSM